MKPMEAAAKLANLETYLSVLRNSDAVKAKKRFDGWRQAVNTARAYIIAHETIERMQEVSEDAD